jgi:hypothetical protein
VTLVLCNARAISAHASTVVIPPLVNSVTTLHLQAGEVQSVCIYHSECAAIAIRPDTLDRQLAVPHGFAFEQGFGPE